MIIWRKKCTTLTIAQHGSSPPVPHRNIIQSPVVKIVHISCNFHHPQILPRQIVDSNLLTQNPSKGVISNKKNCIFHRFYTPKSVFLLVYPNFYPSTLFSKTKKSPSIFFSGSVRHWKAFESFLKALDKHPSTKRHHGCHSIQMRLLLQKTKQPN